MDPDKRRGWLDFSSTENNPKKVNGHTQVRHNHISLALILIVILAIIIILLISPALKGYQFSKEFENLEIDSAKILSEVESVKANKIACETKLESCNVLNEDYLGDLTEERNVTYIKEENNKALQAEIDKLNYNITQLTKNHGFDLEQMKIKESQNKSIVQKDLEQLQITYAQLEDVYEETTQNSANNICCKVRVDDSSIDSYVIVDNKVSCMSGEDSKIAC